MRLSKLWGVLGLLVIAGAASAAGCGGDEDGSGGATSGTEDCSQKDPACQGGACVALADNAGKTTFGLRMAQLTVTRPAALTNQLVQSIVGNGVLMNLEQCRLTGLGTFNWLLEFDTTSGMLRTGGALPRTDPRQGYCFLDEMVGGFPVQPVTVAYQGDGGVLSADVGDIQVPIYTDLAATETPILLPLKAARVTQATLSADNNCMGTYNAEGLLPPDRCLPSRDIPTFVEGAALEGHIILEDADQVLVEDLNQSLCVVLAGTDAQYNDNGKCARDASGAILFKGDYCSTTGSDGGCQDAVKLGATFAASAVDITGICP